MSDYQRGYFAGSRGRWPEHRPPHPPHKVTANLAKAAQELRDSADSICASLSEDDDFVQQLAPKIDALDNAMAEISVWLKSEAERGEAQ